MELEAERRADLAQAFLDTYLEETGDEALRELLPFYRCYRACARGKVQAFLLDESEVPPAQRDVAEQQARRLFALARHYTRGRVRPALVLVDGTMGTGKSTVASRLHQALGWPLVSSDLVRKRLAHMGPKEPVAEAYGQGIYNAEWTERTYRAMVEAARATWDDRWTFAAFRGVMRSRRMHPDEASERLGGADPRCSSECAQLRRTRRERALRWHNTPGLRCSSRSQNLHGGAAWRRR